MAYPSHRPVSAREALEADREAVERAKVPAVVLMEHAGRGLATLVASYPEALEGVTVVAGPGGNGGDGYACARFLTGFGFRVRIVAAFGGAPASAATATEREWALAESIPHEVAAHARDRDVLARAIAGAGLVVDALLGVGLASPMRDPYSDWVRAMNDADALRVSADVPSGLHSDTGEPLPVAVRADVTAAMGMPKAGCFTEAGARHCGRIVEIDVGLPPSIHRRFLARDARARG